MADDIYNTKYDDKIEDVNEDKIPFDQKVNPDYFLNMTLANITRCLNSENLQMAHTQVQMNAEWFEIQLEAQKKLPTDYAKQIDEFKKNEGWDKVEEWNNTTAFEKRTRLAFAKLRILLKNMNVHRPVVQVFHM